MLLLKLCVWQDDWNESGPSILKKWTDDAASAQHTTLDENDGDDDNDDDGEVHHVPHSHGHSDESDHDRSGEESIYCWSNLLNSRQIMLMMMTMTMIDRWSLLLPTSHNATSISVFYGFYWWWYNDPIFTNHD